MLDMEDAEGGPEGEGAGRIRSRNYQMHLFRRRGNRGEGAYRTPDGPGGATRAGFTDKRSLQNAEARLTG